MKTKTEFIMDQEKEIQNWISDNCDRTDGLETLMDAINFGIELTRKIEKQWIIDAYWGGLNGFMNSKDKIGGGAEDYYNEKFKNK